MPALAVRHAPQRHEAAVRVAHQAEALAVDRSRMLHRVDAGQDVAPVAAAEVALVGAAERGALAVAAARVRPVCRPRAHAGHPPGTDHHLGTAHGGGGQALSCLVDLVEPTGPDTLLTTTLNGASVTCRTHPREAVQPGQTMTLSFNLSKTALFDPVGGERIL
jgi:multiple sugar transport system ATP-binding protein